MLFSSRFAAVVVALAGATQAGAISISLGAGSQELTLYGQGPISSGVGSFKVGQGASTFDGLTSTFTFSGAITSGDAGFDSGTYSFITKYAGPDTPQAGPAAPFAQSNPSSLNFFYYDFLDPSTSVTLFLNTPSQKYAISLVAGGNFIAGTGYSFAFTAPTCTGVATCTQNNVGLTPGATIHGPVTINANFTIATAAPGVPEPSVWALFVAGFGAIGFTARRRQTALAA